MSRSCRIGLVFGNHNFTVTFYEQVFEISSDIAGEDFCGHISLAFKMLFEN